VSIAGEQLGLVEYLHNYGMLRAKPCRSTRMISTREIGRHVRRAAFAECPDKPATRAVEERDAAAGDACSEST